VLIRGPRAELPLDETATLCHGSPMARRTFGWPYPITLRMGFSGNVVTATAKAPLACARAARACPLAASGTTANRDAPLPDMTTGEPPPSCRRPLRA